MYGCVTCTWCVFVCGCVAYVCSCVFSVCVSCESIIIFLFSSSLLYVFCIYFKLVEVQQKFWLIYFIVEYLVTHVYVYCLWMKLYKYFYWYHYVIMYYLLFVIFVGSSWMKSIDWFRCNVTLCIMSICSRLLSFPIKLMLARWKRWWLKQNNIQIIEKSMGCTPIWWRWFCLCFQCQ